jgi:uncharacterized membrane protein YidH (DUF202 family)
MFELAGLEAQSILAAALSSLDEITMPPQSSRKSSLPLSSTLSRGSLASVRTLMAWFRFPIAIVILLMLTPAVRAADSGASDPAAQQIENFYAALIDTMKRGTELGLQGRFRQLTPAAQETFDLAGMAQIAVGAPWQMYSDMDRKAVVDAFERLTIANYAKHFTSSPVRNSPSIR